VTRGGWAVAGIAVVAVAAGSVWAARQIGDGEAASATTAAPPVETATVERRDLVESTSVDGQLGYGPSRPLRGAGGTITALPALGSVLDQGATLWEVDGHAGPALFLGDKPLWRTLRRGVDDGTDVQLLEENLVALGHADGLSLTVDQEFTSATATAVKRWQKARGLEQTGVVAPTDAVVSSGPVRVSKHAVSVGDDGGGAVIEVTGAVQLVLADVETDLAPLLAPGMTVTVEMPDDSTVAATVYAVSTVAQAAAEGGAPTVEVVLALPEGTTGLDDAPVDLEIVTSKAEGVLAVPVRALLALAEGGYALEKHTGGTTQLVPVEVGAFADGWVQVQGDVAEGDEVVVPR
jgi:peptidoglycan hydrolase-like protein with peptidoglycan-binding domain